MYVYMSMQLDKPRADVIIDESAYDSRQSKKKVGL